ncbi:MAG: hypothetical protein HYX34_11880 [Actinobacteria bacterium]|nr:hypothetical protein [Actinomycetota bacterium]
MRPSIDRPEGADRSRQLRRLFPAVVVIAVVAVIAAALVLSGGKKDTATKTDAAGTGKLPPGAISWSLARQRNLKDLTWPKTCDRQRGRVAIPWYFAAECFANTPNKGATARGVTGSTIKVVVYQTPANDPIISYVSSAVRSDDTTDQQRRTIQTYVDMFNRYYQTYGRKVKVSFLTASGPANDEVAARADAAKAAGMGAFAVLGGPPLTPAFADELAARKVTCIGCIGGGTPDWYQQRAPYVFTVGANVVQGQDQVIEYLRKQVNGRKASRAGDPQLRRRTRVFGTLAIETSAESKTLAQRFKREAAKAGIKLAAQIPYQLDPARLQEQAAADIAKLKAAGVTSVVFSGDPLAPQSFTAEATRQGYFPEWIIALPVLVDTAAFGRTYDQRQWANAFGISYSTARIDPNIGASYFLHKWFTGKPPPASATSALLLPNPAVLFAGIQAAGPTLTAQTLRDGLFSLRPRQAISQVEFSYGRHGIWPYNDYNGVDDTTEIWWDAKAKGPDEIRREGTGLYRYVDGGRRYQAGAWPRRDSGAFVLKGSVTILTRPPARETPPDYPSPAGSG